ncbi:MAG: hypothetical protein AUJ92_10345 [Armatimonadetes bacterium CG2_30_59_28]|nr:Hpt domain-containing protein [Armatimonadota bacterium]OIO94293.1 MAG: hypothetical protein AUJ92_10345 [Armatimonadetes bacterium CG2_30_59_28]
MALARQALQDGNTSELRRAAHTLKSNAASFGLRALSSAARELEHVAAQGIIEGSDELLRQMEARYEEAKKPLEAARGEI